MSGATLLRRVFAVDPLAGPRADGRRQVVAAVTEAAAPRRLLGSRGLADEPPPSGPGRPTHGAHFVEITGPSVRAEHTEKRVTSRRPGGGHQLRTGGRELT
jgi:hypothetical protein